MENWVVWIDFMGEIFRVIFFSYVIQFKLAKLTTKDLTIEQNSIQDSVGYYSANIQGAIINVCLNW